ncbi:hypothetical protein HON71_04185 [Candidatus Woesearchaeota archaeon]|nr:hypothetical protein [Candidatus Woesearchaeota archaeon]
MKKSWLFTLMSLLLIPTALAEITDTLGNIWDKVLLIGDLSLLGLTDSFAVIAVTRILIWVLMFTVFFAVINAFSGKEGKGLGFLGKNHAVVVAGVIATIAAIFLPDQVLAATGAGWATAIALILIGGPIVGLAYTLFNLTKWMGQEHDTKGTVILKLSLCLLLFWILNVMKFHLGGLF